MLYYALIFLIVALVAGVLGFSGIAESLRTSPGSCSSLARCWRWSSSSADEARRGSGDAGWRRARGALFRRDLRRNCDDCLRAYGLFLRGRRPEGFRPRRRDLLQQRLCGR
jgi:hypothetical protein